MGQRNFKPKHGPVGRKFNPRKDIDEMYDKNWERYRARYLKVNTECYACGVPSQVVDHLIPHKGDPALFLKLDNHIPLCFVCHNTVTTKFDRNYKVGGVIDEKIKWLNLRRFPTEKWTPKRVKVMSYYK